VMLGLMLDGGKCCVLVTTGAMNPIHRGHVNMLFAAKDTMEAAGWHVISGFKLPKP
jgi:nicotinic acid mononucleotide adenylyltransferase